jgi:hypothetical protein
MKKSIYIILLIIIPILSSCNKLSSSVVVDETCSPPCWEGITPGTTSRDEVHLLLEDISWVNGDSIQDVFTVSPNDSVKWMGTSKASDYSGKIFLKGDLVTVITISPKERVLKFVDIIHKLGDPENILAVTTRGERAITAVFILYPSKGYGFLDYYYSSNTDIDNPIQVKPEEYVKQVWYCKPEHFYKYMASGEIAYLPINLVDTGMQKWVGFGKYKSIEQK